jgi:hypothetical protein
MCTRGKSDDVAERKCCGDIDGGLISSPVPGDELVGNIIQVIADELRLGADSQNIVADPLDQCSFPTGSDGAERVPGMAGDETELGGANRKLSRHKHRPGATASDISRRPR